jgi:hypothetical protein
MLTLYLLELCVFIKLSIKILTSFTVKPSELYGVFLSVQTIKQAREMIEDFFVREFYFEKMENTTFKLNNNI